MERRQRAEKDLGSRKTWGRIYALNIGTPSSLANRGRDEATIKDRVDRSPAFKVAAISGSIWLRASVALMRVPMEDLTGVASMRLEHGQ